MNENQLMSEIFEYRKILLGEMEERFLQIICSHREASVYDIFLILRDLKRPMNYRNVHTRTKRLKELGLIEVEEGKFKRNAIKYKVTSRGIFQLMLMSYFLPSTMIKYEDNIIMQTIVYEYFETQTIKKFVTIPRVRALHEYLRECCEAILKKLQEFREPNLLIPRIQSEHSILVITKKSLVQIQQYLLPEIKQLIGNHIKKFLFQIINVSKIKWTLIDHDPNSPGYQKYRLDDDPDENEDGANYTTLFPIPALNQDKKFIELLKEVKQDFDNGCKDFL